MDAAVFQPLGHILLQPASAGIGDRQPLQEGCVGHKFGNGGQALTKASAAVAAKNDATGMGIEAHQFG